VAALAREMLGHPSLQPGQEESVEALLQGRDVLAVMPTGSGKSAIYQLAGTAGGGLTVVVSPLLALQRDQLASLESSGLGPAAILNSTLSGEEERQTLDAIKARRLRFLLLGPEQLQRPELQEVLCAAPPELVAVDEAHCASSWGFDFRPDYLHLRSVIELWDHPRVLALTATAAGPVRTDIIETLGLRQPVVVVAGFDRPNLSLQVESFLEDEDRDVALTAAVAGESGAGIVYAATRRRCEELARRLLGAEDPEEDVPIDPDAPVQAYHAGLRAQEREEIETRFMSGQVRVVVATTAFGMGIDKPDVRFVFHAEPSDSVDSYYQEIGRAGRDGEPARITLFYRPEDLHIRRFFASSAVPDPEEVKLVLKRLRRGRTLSIEEVAVALGGDEWRAQRMVGALERVGAAAVLPGGAVVAQPGAPRAQKVVKLAEEDSQSHEMMAKTRIEAMRMYAEERGCRRRFLLGYFGQSAPGGCGNCDNCRRAPVGTRPAPRRRSPSRPDPKAGGQVTVVDTRITPRTEAGSAGGSQAGDGDGPFPVGAKVVHKSWGEGEVLSRDGDDLFVMFRSAGYRLLSEQLVNEAGLLRPA
jgi:ATP-dependent DNA helicase RecQ